MLISFNDINELNLYYQDLINKFAMGTATTDPAVLQVQLDNIMQDYSANVKALSEREVFTEKMYYRLRKQTKKMEKLVNKFEIKKMKYSRFRTWLANRKRLKFFKEQFKLVIDKELNEELAKTDIAKAEIRNIMLNNLLKLKELCALQPPSKDKKNEDNT